MPTVKIEDGYIVRVLTNNEHNPPHVHVYKTSGECRVLLGDARHSPELWDVIGGMSVMEARKAEQLVRRYQAECLAVWRKFNGHL